MKILVLLLSSMLTALAVPVTFQVNMSVQRSTGNFDPATHIVEVHGAFDGWGPGVALSPSQSDSNIYQGVVDVPGAAGATVQYKFVINQSGTLLWENNGLGPNGAQNRAFTLASSVQTLPVVYFNNQAAPPGVVRVTFQVNMEIQKSMGRFDPANHTVEAHGTFNNWGALTLSPSSTNANVFKETVEITGSPGTAIEYKFVINPAGTAIWEGNVGSGGAFGNRVFTLAQGEQVLPVVYFDNLSVDPGAGIPVTFQVDMSVQAALGLFNPSTGTVNLAGAFNNWSTTETVLTNSPSNTNIYKGTVRVKSASGSSVPYKFLINGATWETGDNRTFAIQGPEQVLPVVYFNNLGNLGPLAITRSSATEVTVSWSTTLAVRLERATRVTGPWEDVPNAAGVSSITVSTAGAAAQFFRLSAP